MYPFLDEQGLAAPSDGDECTAPPRAAGIGRETDARGGEAACGRNRAEAEAAAARLREHAEAEAEAEERRGRVGRGGRGGGCAVTGAERTEFGGAEPEGGDDAGDVEAEGGDDTGDVEEEGEGGGAARWIRQSAVHATGEAAWRRRAETSPAMWRRRAEVAAWRDGSGGQRPARSARQREGEHGADDVEGGGRRWWRGVMNPVARRDRRGGVEAEGGVGADDVEAAARRDAMEAEEA
uniref:Uncharacterized protein n=1 Tax=Oryza sativa subsp. japonica TaxID=39947 RepID=Q6YUW2_ORYSJ|nr:hypothetical protein [Oryza sativa Japonica Group]